MSSIWVVKFISVGRPGTPGENQNWIDNAVDVPGEPFAVIEDRSMIRIYYRELATAEKNTAAEKSQLNLEI